MTVSSWQSTEAGETHCDGIPSMLSFRPLWNNSCRSLISVGLIIWEKWTRNQSRGVPNYPAGACLSSVQWGTGRRKQPEATSHWELQNAERTPWHQGWIWWLCVTELEDSYRLLPGLPSSLYTVEINLFTIFFLSLRGEKGILMLSIQQSSTKYEWNDS